MTDTIPVAGAVRLRARKGGTWRGAGWRVWLPAGVLTVIFAVLVLPPIATLIGTSLTDSREGGADRLTLVNFVRLLSQSNLYSSAWNSVVFATGATVVGLLIGGLLAWIVERTNAPLKGLAFLTVIVSMGTPYILYVVAWFYLLGRAGPFFGVLRALFGITELPFNVYSMWGMIFIEGFLWSPLVFLMLSPIFRRSSAELEEAARMSGASVAATLWRVSVRLALPALAGAAIFVFIRNLEAFDAPVLIGMPGRVNLLTTEIYYNATRTPPDHGLASAFAVVLVVLVALMIGLLGRFTGNADRFASVTGKGFRPRPLDLGGLRWAGGAFILLYFFFVLALPMAALLWTSLMPFVRPMAIAALPFLTFKHYAQVLADPNSIRLAVNTLTIAASAATLTVVLTVLAGWVSVRKWPGSGFLDQMTSVPLVFPGIVLAVAMVEIALRLPFTAYGTLWIISVAFVIRYIPYGMRYAHSGILQIHRELEEAAGVAGATQRGILRRVVVPLLGPAILSAWLFIFLLGAKELSVAVILAGPSSQTVAVSMFNQLSNGTSNELAAMGVIWTAVLTVCACAFYLLTRRQAAAGMGA